MDGVLVPWVVAATILLFVAAYWIYTLEQRLRVFTSRYEDLLKIAEALTGTPDQAVLLPLLKRLDAHDTRLSRAEEDLASLSGVVGHSVQGLGVVRYSAFEGIGGDQSFSVALVDGSGDGTVITGLHGGENIRVYAKPLRGWRSSYSLSADEQRALSDARGMIEHSAH
jgi:hypothetical protein